MPDKFNRPSDPTDALYHDVLCGNLENVEQAIRDTPELVQGRPVIDGAWSHGGRRCAPQDQVIECLWLIIENGARFETCHVETLDSAFKTFPRAAELLFYHGANAKVQDEQGTTVLHLMTEIGYYDAVAFLLGISDRDAKTVAGETALEIARKHGHNRIAQLLDTGQHVALTLNVADFATESPTGITTWYRADRGYGYLRHELYGDLFFDSAEMSSAPPEALEQGVPVSFAIERDRFGLRATSLAFP